MGNWARMHCPELMLWNKNQFGWQINSHDLSLCYGSSDIKVLNAYKFILVRPTCFTLARLIWQVDAHCYLCCVHKPTQWMIFNPLTSWIDFQRCSSWHSRPLSSSNMARQRTDPRMANQRTDPSTASQHTDPSTVNSSRRQIRTTRIMFTISPHTNRILKLP